MQIIAHADDFGVSKGVTDNIIDEGVVRSISVIVNGAAFDYALAEYRNMNFYDQ